NLRVRNRVGLDVLLLQPLPPRKAGVPPKLRLVPNLPVGRSETEVLQGVVDDGRRESRLVYLGGNLEDRLTTHRLAPRNEIGLVRHGLRPMSIGRVEVVGDGVVIIARTAPRPD